MSDERVEFSSPVEVPWGALYSRLDEAELTTTREEMPKVVVFPPPRPQAKPPRSRVAEPIRITTPPAAIQRTQPPRPSHRRAGPPRPMLQEWFETPVIRTSHIAVLVVSGLLFGAGLSSFALLALASMPGLEFLSF